MPGQLLVIPGIGGTGLQTELTSNRLSGAMMTDGEEAVAGFTNPRGVWNKYSGTWDVTPGRVRNGQFWYEPKKNLKKRSAEDQTQGKRKDAKKPIKAQRTKVASATSSVDESDARPPKKKMKTAVRQTRAPTRSTDE
ncbi:hypothetical protein PI125_g9049 [Phytophthora idaei]|nr:hypothetical protein PI125_g9049 [Phytophthora idaei]